MTLPIPSNEAFLSLSRRVYGNLLGTVAGVEARRAIAIVRVDPGHLEVRLVDISSGDARQLTQIGGKKIDHFADCVAPAIAELFREHGRQPGDDVTLFDQKLAGEANAYRWILVNPITMDPDNSGGREWAEEYRHIA